MMMPLFSGRAAELTNWNRSADSPCFLYEAASVAQIARALEVARVQRLTVIPHGAGHSYTDAALNTRGVVIDLIPILRLLFSLPRPRKSIKFCINFF
jgi:FAD/FMN-containing dehydrogenase